MLVILADSTARVRAERRVRAEHERLARMFEQAPAFMALLREPGHVFEFANAALHQLVGERAVVGRTIADALPELVDQGVLDMLDTVTRTGEPHKAETMPLRLRHMPDGPEERRLLTFVCQPIRDDDGAVTGIFVGGTDVTEQARIEERLTLSEGALRLATEVAAIGTWDLDLATDTLVWNDATKAMFGISPENPCSMRDFEAGLHPDDLEATTRAFASALDPVARATYDVEYRVIGKEDGVLRWVAARGRGIFVDDVCARAIGTAIDITERRRADTAMREIEDRFRTVADSAPVLIWMSDATGKKIFANRWHEEMFGRPAAEFLGGGWNDILHPDDRAAALALQGTAIADHAPFSLMFRVIDRNGATRWLQREARPRTEAGVFAGYVGCDADITEAHIAAEALEQRVAERTAELADTNRALSAQIEERERVEATLRQMQRLEAIGQLTSGVAHDFNNLLTVILGNVDMVARTAREAGLDERTLRRLVTVRGAAERGATLTGQLLAFSRRQRLEARAVDLNDTVAGMRDLLQSSMGGSVRLETRPMDGLWPALVDPTQIELIILNLAINARDAMQVGGSLTVETANVTLGAPTRPEEPAPGDYVMIAVTDDGIGMTPEVRAKAFEPFFTTKAVGKGSGLGLAQVYGFATQSGGGVAIDTAPDEGTTVRVYLPRASDLPEQAPPPIGTTSGAGARAATGRRILVVDDDRDVRDVTTAALRAIGATITEADSGAQALAELEEAAGGFDLMVADFAMPGMNGAELAAAALIQWPTLPVLYVTGYADFAAIASVGPELIVRKPFRAEDLQAKVTELLVERAKRAD